MEKMLKMFDEEPDVRDLSASRPLCIQGGCVEFKNVSFSYDGKQGALHGISFTIPAGKTAALVGPSGGGKSTILRCLFRFYDVSTGNIYIDGQNIRNVTQLSLRRAIGVVPQDTTMYNDTILYNIRYARPSATDEEVFTAAKAAQIHEKILSFPQKYNTVVGERGLRLSGGERQRVAIARTILKNPSIITLDEATSSLDSSTERQIQQALKELCRHRTTLIIAHRLSTIMSADVILVLKEGTVVESGSHAQLLEKHGLYYELWNKQVQSENSEYNSPKITL
jgi:ABC-type transport system involved in Fe-S cluster assembly fused permease/ATPase subunit